MSERELGVGRVRARVRSKHLRVVDAASTSFELPAAKRLWKRYGEEDASGLESHSIAGGRSRTVRTVKDFRRRVLGLVRKKTCFAVLYTPSCVLFVPDAGVMHLVSDGTVLRVDAETLLRWMLAAGLWSLVACSATTKNV